MANFTFNLKNEKSKTYERISWFLILMNVSLLLFMGAQVRIAINPINYFITAGLVLLAALYSYIGIRYKQRESNYSAAFAIASFFWFTSGMIWIGIINLLLLAFEVISKRKLEIVINKSSISYPSFPKKELEWVELNNLILKEGILTIDCKNNKLIQVNVEESSENIDEKKFNDFCREQLNK